jgi:hypothetical protein
MFDLGAVKVIVKLKVVGSPLSFLTINRVSNVTFRVDHQRGEGTIRVVIYVMKYSNIVE